MRVRVSNKVRQVTEPLGQLPWYGNVLSAGVGNRRSASVKHAAESLGQAINVRTRWGINAYRY